MKINGITGVEIPYYGMMKKAMPGPTKEKKHFKNHRVTEIDPKTKKPRLKNGISVQRAVEILYMFENTDTVPYQIEEMKATIENQRKRILKLEDWE